ncbi:DEKNAAC105206 [Brettanomyces naardenensis]|uniref:DEKNAAC105206 n=1 Tax=Brettanomyces naardenensis TaxID=13370 RepID=A0A448YSL0_BRENA|nr:DEKNAAC105206 [Brettanomyces naardenensis]
MLSLPTGPSALVRPTRPTTPQPTTASPSSSKIDLIRSFSPSKVFKNHTPDTPITSISYDIAGQYLLSSGTDETLQLYDVPKGRHLKSIYSKKYGCHLAIFSNTSHSKCLFASTKENHIIRFLDLNDNSFIRYFKGHSEQVTSLVNSTSGTRLESFYSSSLDGTVKCWDMRTDSFTASLGLSSTPLIALDPSNSVMAILETGSKTLRLVSMEKFPTGLIRSVDLTDPLGSTTPKKLEFTNDNKYIVINTDGDHLVLDSFSLQVTGLLTGQVPFTPRSYPDSGNLTVTPNGKIAIAGSGNGELLIWDLSMVSNGEKLTPTGRILPKMEAKVIPRMVLFNPQYEMLTTADTEVGFWVRTSN